MEGEKRIHLKVSSGNDRDNIRWRIVRRVKFMDNMTMRNVKDEISRLNIYQETASMTENKSLKCVNILSLIFLRNP